MGFRFEGFVGTNFNVDGDAHSAPLRFGRGGELVVYENHGKFYESCLRGNVFVGTSATPIAIPIDSSTTVTPTLWNPLGSGVVAEIIRLSLTHDISTPEVPGGMTWGITNPAGADIGTAAPITLFTNIPPVNLLIGSGRVSKVRYAQIGTFAAAPAYFMGAGITNDAWTAASTYPPWLTQVDYDGMLVVPPGTALSLHSTAATGGLYFVSIIFIESLWAGMGA